MSKYRTRFLPLALLLCAFGGAASVPAQTRSLALNSRPATPAPTVTDRQQDGLLGPVRRVRTETAKLTAGASGQLVEGGRVVLEVASYDMKGRKIDNAYYPVSGNTLTGKEVYKYDEKGNITEMTLYGTGGAVLSKEVYNYEYDTLGNWTKMTTSLAVIEEGKIVFEPAEVTYRVITYYLENASARLLQPTLASGTSGRRPTLAALPSGSAALQRSVVAPAAAGQVAGATEAMMIKLEDEPPARPGRRGSLRPVSGGVLNGTALTLPKPLYPEAARRARATGLVSVEVVVDEKGAVISARAISGPSLLHQPAVAAAQQARFSPTLLSGQPVKVSGLITYNFVNAQ